MAHRKFDKTDRGAVIRTVEKALGISLKRQGRRQKWLKDQNGKNFWVLGGYGEWHGIPEEMMDAEITEQTNGFIVVAIRQKTDMQIFMGPIQPVLEGRSKLYRAAETTGDYQFTFKKIGSSIAIKQLLSISLKKLSAISFSDEEKEKEKLLAIAEEYLDGMSAEEKEKLLDELKKGT